jgi:hypothetical protein
LVATNPCLVKTREDEVDRGRHRKKFA